MGTIKCIKNGQVVSVPKAVRCGPKGTVRAIIASTLLLFAAICFGQKPLMPTVVDYVLPASQWNSLTTMPDSGKVCTGYGDDPTVYEVFSYNAQTNEVRIKLWNSAVLFNEANSIEEEYNDYTGVRVIHFYTLSANDCSTKKYHMRASYYERPSSKGYCFVYESLCEGVSIVTGDTMLPKALKYKPPTKTTTRKTSSTFKITGQ